MPLDDAGERLGALGCDVSHSYHTSRTPRRVSTITPRKLQPTPVNILPTCLKQRGTPSRRTALFVSYLPNRHMSGILPSRLLTPA